MNITKKIILVLIFTFLVGFSVILLLPKEVIITNKANCLRIGAGDDISGLLLERIKSISENIEIDTITDKDSGLETLEFKDC